MPVRGLVPDVEGGPQVIHDSDGNELNCGSCRWFDPDESVGSVVGKCRVNPPTIDMMPIYAKDERTVAEQISESEIAVAFEAVDQIDVTQRAVWPTVDALADGCAVHIRSDR